MFLESVVLSCSYMRYILSHMGRVVILSILLILFSQAVLETLSCRCDSIHYTPRSSKDSSAKLMWVWHLVQHLLGKWSFPNKWPFPCNLVQQGVSGLRLDKISCTVQIQSNWEFISICIFLRTTPSKIRSWFFVLPVRGRIH
jgi:hypothetical protein